MKTAIVYATKHGTTGKVAMKLKEALTSDEVELFNLAENNRIEFRSFDRIVIGSSIYAGSIQPAVKRFVEQNMVDLLQKEVGIFVCCMFFEKADEQIGKAFPEVLRNHAKSVKHMGGEFLFDQLNFIERVLVRKITGVTNSVSKIDISSINSFITEINNN
jgi:menaquinone-dependent protoporphyrinogen oxidase